MQPWKRFAPPVVAVAAVAAYAVIPVATASGAAHPNLPAITAAQLLTKVETAHVTGLTGTVHESADLGLPSLPSGDTGGALTGLLSGSHTLTVAAAPDKLRVAVLGTLSEQDLVVDGDTVKTYDSTTGKATSTTLPAHAAPMAPGAQSLTPQQAAQQAIAALDPTTVVTVDPTTEVAGRAAYTLVLTPRTTETLVSRVEVAVDAATGMPLRTAVYAVGHAAPALSTAFTTISYGTPAAKTFALDAPVTTGRAHAGATTTHDEGTSRTSTVGEGWSAVTKITGLALSADERTQLDQVSTAVPAGRLVTTRLVSVLITPAGTAYVGAVPPSVLEKDAA